MQLEYDPEADAIYISLTGDERPVSRTEELDDLRSVDYDANGEPVGVEFLSVSDGIDLARVPQQASVAEILRAVHVVTAA